MQKQRQANRGQTGISSQKSNDKKNMYVRLYLKEKQPSSDVSQYQHILTEKQLLHCGHGVPSDDILGNRGSPASLVEQPEATANHPVFSKIVSRFYNHSEFDSTGQVPHSAQQQLFTSQRSSQYSDRTRKSILEMLQKQITALSKREPSDAQDTDDEVQDDRLGEVYPEGHRDSFSTRHTGVTAIWIVDVRSLLIHSAYGVSRGGIDGQAEEKTEKLFHSNICFQKAMQERREKPANKILQRSPYCSFQVHGSSIWKALLLLAPINGCTAEHLIDRAAGLKIMSKGEKGIRMKAFIHKAALRKETVVLLRQIILCHWSSCTELVCSMPVKLNRKETVLMTVTKNVISQGQPCNNNGGIRVFRVVAGKVEIGKEVKSFNVQPKKMMTQSTQSPYAELVENSSHETYYSIYLIKVLVLTLFLCAIFLKAKEEKASEERTGKRADNDWNEEFEKESKNQRKSAIVAEQENDIKVISHERNDASSESQNESLTTDRVSENWNEELTSKPSSPYLEVNNSPIVKNDQSEQRGANFIQDDCDPIENSKNDHETNNVSHNWNEDLDIKFTPFQAARYPLAEIKDPENDSEKLHVAIKVPSVFDKPSENKQAKESFTPNLEAIVSAVISHGQYGRDDGNGIQDVGDQDEKITTDGKLKNLTTCKVHKHAENEVNGNKSIETKHEAQKCVIEIKGVLKTAGNISEETDEKIGEIKESLDSGYNSIDDSNSSSNDSFEENDIDENVIENKENDSNIGEASSNSPSVISERSETQMASGMQEFRAIGNRLHESEKAYHLLQKKLIFCSGTIAAPVKSIGNYRQHSDRNDQHQLQYKVLHHKPTKPLKIKLKLKNVVPEENLQFGTSQSLRRKLSYEEQGKDKDTSWQKVLHPVSQLPVPKLEVAVFKNESAKLFEPVLEIINQIADGNDPGPQITMRYELLRMCTLRNYPKEKKPFLIHFAKAGFYYAAEGDEVICYCCGLRRHSWVETDVPNRIHQRINPNCKFLNRNPEFNVPIVYTGKTQNLDKLDKLIARLEEEYVPPQASADAESGNDLSEYIPPKTSLTGGLNNPKHRQYVSKAQRLVSFEGWPDNLTQTPEIMADAGFYYAGFGDCVRCYYCGIGLRHWTAEDNVWIEHARWSKHCAFLKQVKGQEFINLVHMAIQYTQDDEERPFSEPSNSGDTELMKKASSEESAVDKILLTDPAQSVLEMGYTPKMIKKAIAFILNRDGRSGISSQTIMEKVLEFEEAENAKTLAGELANMDLGRKDNSSGGPDSGSSLKSSQRTKPSGGKCTGESNAKPLISCKDSRSKSIKEENKKLKEQTLCRICQTNTVCIVLLPCGHLCACDECGSALRTCPVCQKDVKGTVKTYMS